MFCITGYLLGSFKIGFKLMIAYEKINPVYHEVLCQDGFFFDGDNIRLCLHRVQRHNHLQPPLKACVTGHMGIMEVLVQFWCAAKTSMCRI